MLSDLPSEEFISSSCLSVCRCYVFATEYHEWFLTVVSAKFIKQDFGIQHSSRYASVHGDITTEISRGNYSRSRHVIFGTGCVDFHDKLREHSNCFKDPNFTTISRIARWTFPLLMI